MVKVGPKPPPLSRREAEKKEKELKRAAQLESGEDPSAMGEPFEHLAHLAPQLKKARHKRVDEFALEEAKKRWEKNRKRAQARRLAKLVERDHARRNAEGSQGCIEDSLEFLLAEIDRRYADFGLPASQTPIARSESLVTDAGDSFVLPPDDTTVDTSASSLCSSTITERYIPPSLASTNESGNVTAPPEDPVKTHKADEFCGVSTPGVNTEHASKDMSAAKPKGPMSPDIFLATNNSARTMPLARQTQAKTILQTSAAPTQSSLQKTVARPTKAPETSSLSSRKTSLKRVDSASKPVLFTEPLNPKNISSSSKSNSSAPDIHSANAIQNSRASQQGTTMAIHSNDHFGLRSSPTITSQTSSSSVISSGSSLTRASHTDLGSADSFTVNGSSSLSIAAKDLSTPKALATGSHTLGHSRPTARLREESTNYDEECKATAGSFGLGAFIQSHLKPSTPGEPQPQAVKVAVTPKTMMASSSGQSREKAGTSEVLSDSATGKRTVASDFAISQSSVKVTQGGQTNANLSNDKRSSTPVSARSGLRTTAQSVPKTAVPVSRPIANSSVDVKSSGPIQTTNMGGSTTASSRMKSLATLSADVKDGRQSSRNVPSGSVPSSEPVANTSTTMSMEEAPRSADIKTPSLVNVWTSRTASSRQTPIKASTPGEGSSVDIKTPVAPRNVSSNSFSRHAPLKVPSSVNDHRSVGESTLAPKAVISVDARSSGPTTGSHVVLGAVTAPLNVDPEVMHTSVPRNMELEDVFGRIGMTESDKDSQQTPLQKTCAKNSSQLSVPAFKLAAVDAEQMVADGGEGRPGDYVDLKVPQIRPSNSLSSNQSDVPITATRINGNGNVPMFMDGKTVNTGRADNSFAHIFESLDQLNVEPPFPGSSLAPAAAIIEDVRRPVVDSVIQASKNVGLDVERLENPSIPQSATFPSVTSTPISRTKYPDTPLPRSGIIPPSSTPTSHSPRIFTLELPSPRWASRSSAPLLPIHDPNIPKVEEKRGVSLVNALKWVLKKTMNFWHRRKLDDSSV